jgi:TonB family protein
MGLSSIAVQQREKEDEALKSFIVFSLVGSVGLHVAVLSLSSFWVRETKLAEEPIEVTVLDTPSVEAAKPESKPPPKIGGGSKPSASAKTSNPAPETKSSQTASGQEIALPPPAKLEKPPSLKDTSIEKPLTTPQPIPVATPKAAEIPPTPVATPKVAETLPPVPTPQPEVVATPIPTPIASLPSELIAKLKSTPMPTPTPTPTPLASEKPKPIPSPVAVATPKSTPIPIPLTTPPQSPPTPISPRVTAASPSPRNNQPPYTPSAKPSNTAKRSNSPVSQSNIANRNKVSDRSSTPSLQNPAVNNSDSSAPTSSQPGNNSTGQENNNSGGEEKVATAPSNTTQPGEDLLSPRPGSGNLACRRCPDPAYPKRAERRGIEGTVKLVFDVDRDGNISNIRVASSSGHDILDRAATDAVKDWKLASSDSEQQGISQSFTFAKKGSTTESQARERREKQERDRLAREQEQQEKERVAREQQQRQQQEKDRLVREQQRQQQEERDRLPLPTPEPLVTPSPLTEPSPFVEPSTVPFEPSNPSPTPPE